MFSILMPAYNEEENVAAAIHSILNQSYRDIELIVVDDGSEDRTWEIISEISKTDNRLKVFHPGKLGKNGAINFAKEQSSGEWFSIFAADDIMEPGILEKWHAITESYEPHNQDIVIASRIRMFATEKKYRVFEGLEITKKKNEVCKSGAAFLATRKTMEQVFPIPLDFPNEDGWTKLYFANLVDEFVPCPEVCVNYRIHDGNSLNKKAKFREFNEKFHKRSIVSKAFLDKYRARLSQEQIDKLSSTYLLEDARYHGKTFRILFFKNINLKSKLRALFFSNPVLYNIKVGLSRFFLGRS